MSRAAVCLVAVLFMAQARFPPLAPSPTQPARDAVVRTGTGTIRGHIVDAGSRQPVRKARVHAASSALPDGRTAYTDANGAYELSALPAGKYTVTANKVAYVNASYGQPRPLELGTAIDVADGKAIEHIDFTLWRGGVIAGRISDEFGDPLPDTQVQAMHYQNVQGIRRLVAATTRSTNDVGEFRLFGLAPGEYFLSATLRNNVVPMARDAGSSDTYSATYYPGTPSASAAQPLTIAPGQTMSGMNMMLLPVRSVRVSGTAVDSAGQPVKNAAVMAGVRAAGGLQFTGSAPIAADGAFTIQGLAPGEYVLRVRTSAMNGVIETATMPVTVGGSDLTDVRVVTAPPTSIAGRVIIDRDEAASVRGPQFRLTAPPASTEDAGIRNPGPVPNATVKDDFTFEIKAQPGLTFIRSNTTAWFLRSVRVNGVETKDTGFELHANTPVTNVEVELTHKQPEVGGLITDAAGQPTRIAYIVVFPQDKKLWGAYLSRYIRMVRPNAENKYRIVIPPGDYNVIALDYVGQTEFNDPDFLQRAVERAVKFSVAETDKKTLDLSVLPAVQP
jgi:hypothetical protein